MAAVISKVVAVAIALTHHAFAGAACTCEVSVLRKAITVGGIASVRVQLDINFDPDAPEPDFCADEPITVNLLGFPESVGKFVPVVLTPPVAMLVTAPGPTPTRYNIDFDVHVTPSAVATDNGTGWVHASASGPSFPPGSCDSVMDFSEEGGAICALPTGEDTSLYGYVTGPAWRVTVAAFEMSLPPDSTAQFEGRTVGERIVSASDDCHFDGFSRSEIVGNLSTGNNIYHKNVITGAAAASGPYGGTTFPSSNSVHRWDQVGLFTPYVDARRSEAPLGEVAPYDLPCTIEWPQQMLINCGSAGIFAPGVWAEVYTAHTLSYTIDTATVESNRDGAGGPEPYP